MGAIISNDKLVHTFFSNLWIAEDYSAVEERCSPNIIVDSVIKKTIGKKAKTEIARNWFDAFPNRTAKITEVIQKNDTVVLQWESKSIHEGVFCGLAPTGRVVTYSGICYFQVIDKLITTFYSVSNILISLAQAGAMPFQKPNQDIPDIDNKISYRQQLFSILQNNYADLTKREIEIISLWLSGHSNKQTSQFLNISCRTVEGYRARIKDKLKLKDKKSLYEYAREQGLLDISFQLANSLKKASLFHTIDINP